MLKEISSDVYKGFYDTLKNQLTYAGKTVPVFSVLADKTVAPCWVTISQYNQAESGAKTFQGVRASVLIEVNVIGDDYKGLSTLTNAVINELYAVKNGVITIGSNIVFSLFEPNITELVEQTDRIYLRKLIRIEMLIRVV